MSSLLYYPYINLPKSNWTIRALLYYDNISSVVPFQYFNDPDQYEPFMREAILQELITPINPMNILDRPWEISQKFIEYLVEKQNVLERRKNSFSNHTYKIHKDKFSYQDRSYLLHADKFDNSIFDYLVKTGLAERQDNYWYNVESKTAEDLMLYLSSVIADKIDYLVATDRIDYRFSQVYAQNKDIELRTRQYKKDLILKALIPYPQQIDLRNLRRFKDQHHDLLTSFRNKVESIVLNQAIPPESPIFKITLDEMKIQKEELVARMKECHFGNIDFGTICGTISAAIGLFENSSAATIIGLLSAIYSACKIERPESVIDQTGLKYLALVDKKMRVTK